jgi:hypothetical protein
MEEAEGGDDVGKRRILDNYPSIVKWLKAF